jgi:hypothetical protein
MFCLSVFCQEIVNITVCRIIDYLLLYGFGLCVSKLVSTLREEGTSKLRVFESRVLRRIFEPTGEELTEGWRNVPDEKLRSVYSSPNIAGADDIKENETSEAVTHILTA